MHIFRIKIIPRPLSLSNKYIYIAYKKKHRITCVFRYCSSKTANDYDWTTSKDNWWCKARQQSEKKKKIQNEKQNKTIIIVGISTITSITNEPLCISHARQSHNDNKTSPIIKFVLRTLSESPSLPRFFYSILRFVTVVCIGFTIFRFLSSPWFSNWRVVVCDRTCPCDRWTDGHYETAFEISQ